MSLPEVRKVMRGSARRKEKGNGSKMGFVLAHKVLLPRGINNELKLNVAFCTLFQLSCSQSTRADAVSRFSSISRELNVTALVAYQSRYRVFFQWYQPIKSSFPNRFHAGDLVNFFLRFLVSIAKKILSCYTVTPGPSQNTFATLKELMHREICKGYC